MRSVCILSLLAGLQFLAACGGSGGQRSAALQSPVIAAAGASESIVGGVLVKEHSAITLATVSLMEPSGWAFCTGTLIDMRHVVTAAHCLANYHEPSLHVGFGGVAELQPRSVTAHYLVHPGFDHEAALLMHPLHAPHDIALVTLDADVPAGFQPIAMAAASDPLAIGEPLTLAGFGLTKAEDGTSGQLRRVQTKLTAVWPEAQEIEYGGTPGRSACNGDSGGPAFIKREDKFVLVGVTSRGLIGCTGTGIYTDIRPHSLWLSTAAKP